MTTPDKTKIPPNTKHTIDLWVSHGLQPGSGTLAILRNDLVETFARCDEPTIANLPHIVAYLLWGGVPAECWGSAAKVKAWRGIEARP